MMSVQRCHSFAVIWRNIPLDSLTLIGNSQFVLRSVCDSCRARTFGPMQKKNRPDFGRLILCRCS